MDIRQQLSTYLARIGMELPLTVNPETLALIQFAHRTAIPFENLNISIGREIACGSDVVFAKMVNSRRGGFCFEHNRLLSDMLTAAGFANRILLARVLLGDPAAPTPRTHCLVLVTFGEKQWITDAGFGGSYAPPMRLCDGERAETGDGAQHRLTRIGDDGDLPGAWLLERRGPKLATDGRVQSDDVWEPQYAFDLAQVAEADLALGCYWSATHESSRFTNLTVASICLPDGFASLVDRQLTVWRKGAGTDRRTLETPEAYGEALSQVFGIALEAADIARLPLF